jgi:S1-C subfamily serine protease
MRRIVLSAALILLAFGVVGAQDLKEIEEAYLKVVRKVRPTVVAVSVVKMTTRNDGDRLVNWVSSTQFSGVVVSDKGHIATIAKGVSDASRIYVDTLEGNRHEAELVGVDEKANVGIIKLKDTQNWNVQPVEFGDSDKVEVGSLIVIVGCPSGLKHSVVYGNVSGLKRTLVSSQTFYTDMIQLSNPVSHADPGGLVANSEGKLVGLVSPAFIKTPSFRRVEELIDALDKRVADLTEKLGRKQEQPNEARKPRRPSEQVEKGLIPPQLPADLFDPALSQGINFAIPGNSVKQVCERIIDKKAQPWVGVLVRDLMPPEKVQLKVNGIFVLEVVADSPASASGLQNRDIILRMGEKAIEDVGQFRNAIDSFSVGDEVTLTVFRKQEEMQLKLKLGKRE